MILYIGGSFQNKEEFVKSHEKNPLIWGKFHLFVKESLKKGLSPQEIEEETFRKIEALEKEALQSSKKVFIVCDELGCGVIPLQEQDRLWRETTGRLLCKIAGRAEKVLRLICGIQQVIK